MVTERNVIWTPQPKQAQFLARPEYEALYGGAAGGGKSDALLVEATRQVHIPHYRGLILRRTYPQLEALVSRSMEIYGRAFPGARYRGSDHVWLFPSGAKVFFGYLQNESDKYNYQGKPYDFIAFDELTTFTMSQYMYLLSRNRPTGSGTRVYVRATANPGGIGHGWVKERFIDPAPPMTPVSDNYSVTAPDGSVMTMQRDRIFVPSTVFDNQILLKNDPMYVATLASLPAAERDALLYGNWDTFHGQYFAEFKDDPAHYKDRQYTHVIEPFDIPKGWRIYRSFDWGYARPFSAGYWAIDYDGVVYRILEVYGCTKDPNTGVKWTPDEVFRKLREVEDEHPYLKGKRIDGVADPAIWSAEYGESIAETASKYHIYFDKGDHERIAGWMQVRYRMMFDDNGYPMMYVFNTCKDFIRTIPSLIYDDHKPEDLDSDGEDHIADETRYFCMTRPIKPVMRSTPVQIGDDPLNMVRDSINRKGSNPFRK